MTTQQPQLRSFFLSNWPGGGDRRRLCGMHDMPGLASAPTGGELSGELTTLGMVL